MANPPVMPFMANEPLETPRALIFDCDGTLVDSMPAHFVAWSATLRRYGITFPESRFYALGGVPTHTIIELLCEEQGVSVDVARVARERDDAFIAAVDAVKPIDRIVEVARRHRGVLPMGVATGGTQRQARAGLTAIGILEWFETIVAADDVERSKPAPDVFLEVARRLGVPPGQCQVYEDADPGVEAARAAGMQVIDVRLE